MGCGSSAQEARNAKDAKSIENSEKSESVTPKIQQIIEPPKTVTLPEFIIYHGSQTGNSTRFALELQKEAKELYGLASTKCIDLIDFDENSLSQQKFAIFVVSTYGEGGPTDNAQRFYQWLINEHCIEKDKNNFSDFRFTVFGCGDSNFSKRFNRMAKLTVEKLQARGSKLIFELGLGDDSKNLNEDFKNWKQKLWPALINYYKNEQKATISIEAKKCLTYNSQFEISYDVNICGEHSPVECAMSTKQYLLSLDLPIISMKKIRENEQSVSYQIELNLEEAGLKYKTMDNIAIFPENDLNLVEEIAKIQEWDLDKQFVLKIKENQSAKPKIPFPMPITIREALLKFCSLTTLLSYFIRIL